MCSRLTVIASYLAALSLTRKSFLLILIIPMDIEKEM